MNQKEMLQECAKEGLSVSVPLLYRQGKRNGFLKETGGDGKEKYVVDVPAFREWIRNFKAGTDWVPVGEAASGAGIPYSGLLYRLKSGKCELRKMGSRLGGLVHAKRKDVERAVAAYRKRAD